MRKEPMSFKEKKEEEGTWEGLNGEKERKKCYN